jgi:phosphoglycerol geranylgeranyltransferase
MARPIQKCPIWAERGVHLLVDPDKWQANDLRALLRSVPNTVASIIVGGTYIHTDRFLEVMKSCRRCEMPVGNIVAAGVAESHISPDANYLLLPLVFGGHDTRFVLDHIIRAVPLIRRYGLPCTSYAYMMLDGGVKTSAEYLTQILPIPRRKPDILRTFALAARYIGLSGVYLEAGSAAIDPVTPDEVRQVAEASQLPILVGGGIRSALTCRQLFDAGATGIIVGTVLEQTKSLQWLREI